jgi:hypothetical protein
MYKNRTAAASLIGPATGAQLRAASARISIVAYQRMQYVNVLSVEPGCVSTIVGRIASWPLPHPAWWERRAQSRSTDTRNEDITTREHDKIIRASHGTEIGASSLARSSSSDLNLLETFLHIRRTKVPRVVRVSNSWYVLVRTIRQPRTKHVEMLRNLIRENTNMMRDVSNTDETRRGERARDRAHRTDIQRGDELKAANGNTEFLRLLDVESTNLEHDTQTQGAT